MNNKHFTYINYFINLIGILIFAIIIVNLSFLDITSLSSFNPDERNVDFCSVDFYQMVADNKSEKLLDDQIVIIPIDDLSRKDIKFLLEDIAICNPKAIGLDVFFQFNMEGDVDLLHTLRNTSNLITPIGVVSFDNKTYSALPAHLLDSLKECNRGVVNMNIPRRYNVVRDFIPFYPTDHGNIEHFAVALTRQVAPNIIDKLYSKNEESPFTTINIDFSSRDFETIKPHDVLKYINEIKGKIVLVGAINDTQDMHLTPTSDAMPGIKIHAYTLSTILREHYKNEMPQWALWIVGLFICILFVGAKILFDKIVCGNTLMRLFQFIMLLFIVYIGCVLYIKFNYIIELSLPLTLVALGLVALDFWRDLCRIIIKIAKYMNIKFVMRYFSIFLLICISSASIQAAPFHIFEYEGDVKLLRNGIWVEITEKQEILYKDRIRLGNNAKLGIVDYNTRRIYYTRKTGEQNVSEIISASRKEDDRIAYNMGKTLINSTLDDNNPIVIIGGVNRGANEFCNATSNIYNEIYKRLKCTQENDTEDIDATLVTEGKTFYFKIKNNTCFPLFINIIKIPKEESEKPQLCLEVGYTKNKPYIAIGPEKETDLNQYVFLAEETPRNYLVCASQEPFDCQELKILLNTFAIPQDDKTSKKKYIYLRTINNNKQ